ncbi:MAG: DUF5659 domain-containing protein [Bacteroidota bacterium]|jgi:hypothetical protein
MKNSIEVQDLYLAVFLFMQGIPLLRHQRQYDYSTFYFAGGERTETFVDEFMKNDNPYMRFASALRQLKSLMYSDESSRTESFNHTSHHVKQNTGTTLL